MKRFSITYLLIALFVMIGTRTFAHSIAVKNSDGVTIYYSWNNDKTKLSVCYKGSDPYSSTNSYTGKVVIPDSVTYNGTTYPVTSIGSYAFFNCPGLTSIYIPNSVTYIGDVNFGNSPSLTEVHISDIEAWCKIKFASLGANPLRYAHHLYLNDEEIKKLIIPNSITSINPYVFEGCTDFLSIEIPSSVQSIGEYAFYGCSSLESVTIGSGVLTIDNQYFDDVYTPRPTKVIWLTNTPPEGYLNINGKANYVANEQFSSSLSDKIVYPFLSSMFEVDGVKYVPVSPSERTCDAIDCRYDEGTENITIGETVSYKGVEMKVQRICRYGCYKNPYIKNVIISFNGDIEDNAFYGCSNVNQISLINSGNIGESAFYGISGNFTVNINNKGTIGQRAFVNSKGLKNLEIGSNVIDIAASAFAGISGEYVATINNKGAIGQNAFFNSNGLKSLKIGNNVTNIERGAFSGCTALLVAKIENEGTIADNAFNGCSMMAIVTLGESITSIGKSAFARCESLECLVIPDVVTNLGESAFQGCSAMTSVNIGNGIESIRSFTFSECSTLTDIQIGNSVTTIGTSAFSGCSALPKIQIPKNVISIGDNVFQGCKKLQTVIMENQTLELTLGSNGTNPLFADCPLDSVYIGRNITYPTTSDKGYSPFYRNTSLRSVTISDKETEISENEFYGCTNLQNVRIGNGVKIIGNWAFSGCSSLEYYAFGSSVKTIGKEAFSDCTAMTSLYSKASIPPTCGTQALDDINKWECKLFVPNSCMTTYQAADQWKDFFFIEENSIVPEKKGDANGDGTVDTNDIVEIVKYIMNPWDGFNIGTADANGDGVVNVADIIYILKGN